ncbi:Protein SRJ-4, partial [Aphelenchoides avenae]
MVYYIAWGGPGQPPIAGSLNGSYATDVWHPVFRCILLIYTAFDVLLQVYVAFLTLRVSVSTLKEYRYFMLLCTIWNAAMSLLIGFVMQPRGLTPLYGCVSMRGPISLFGNAGALVSFSVAFFVVSNIIACQGVCLAYRLTLVMGRSAHETFMRPVVLAAHQAALLTLSAGIAYGSSEMFETPAFVDESMRAQMVQLEYITDADRSIACFGFTHMTYLATASACIIALISMTQIYSVVVSIIIFRRIQASASELSEKTRRMYKQLTQLLLLQTFTPFVCFLIPVVAACVFILGSVPVNHILVYIGILAIVTFPKLNAVLTIVFVAPYRSYTTDLFYRLRGRTKQTRVTVVEHSNTWASRV